MELVLGSVGNLSNFLQRVRFQACGEWPSFNVSWSTTTITSFYPPWLGNSLTHASVDKIQDRWRLFVDPDVLIRTRDWFPRRTANHSSFRFPTDLVWICSLLWHSFDKNDWTLLVVVGSGIHLNPQDFQVSPRPGFTRSVLSPVRLKFLEVTCFSP